jgi:alpha-tubulin suppressor-like RCC1 family protein
MAVLHIDHFVEITVLTPLCGFRKWTANSHVALAVSKSGNMFCWTFARLGHVGRQFVALPDSGASPRPR